MYCILILGSPRAPSTLWLFGDEGVDCFLVFGEVTDPQDVGRA